MEHELAFTLHLAMYQEADLGDYITFMMNFRGVLTRLKPSEVIELETVYAVNIIDVMMEILPYHDPHDVPWFESFSSFEPADLDNEFMEQEAAKGKGAFVQALWTQYAIPKLYFLVYKAWRRYGAQNLTTWTRLAQAVLDGCFGHTWPDCVFQVPDSCSICLSTMHWPETTQCGHTFHLRCLLRHLEAVSTGFLPTSGNLECDRWRKSSSPDESRFSLSEADDHAHVWRRTGHCGPIRHLLSSGICNWGQGLTVFQTSNFLGHTIIFSGPSRHFDSSQIRGRYFNADCARCRPMLSSHPGAIYQQDNARPHTA
ncbi:hypothetical protein TNCV_3217851 [Trichonephila clavipes]|nr:hypothetical protein TNCV_3217851 [Trichonephila clavipes]